MEDLTSEVRYLKEANTQLNLEVRVLGCCNIYLLMRYVLQLVEEKRFKDSANGRLHELTTELQNTQVKNCQLYSTT